MLYIKEPFIVPVFRLGEMLPEQRIKCECFDIELDHFMSYVVDWTEIHSDVAGELTKATKNPTAYAPSMGELRQWVEKHSAGV